MNAKEPSIVANNMLNLSHLAYKAISVRFFHTFVATKATRTCNSCLFTCVRDAKWFTLVNIVFQNHENSTCGEIRGLVMKLVRFVGSLIFQPK